MRNPRIRTGLDDNPKVRMARIALKVRPRRARIIQQQSQKRLRTVTQTKLTKKL